MKVPCVEAPTPRGRVCAHATAVRAFLRSCLLVQELSERFALFPVILLHLYANIGRHVELIKRPNIFFRNIFRDDLKEVKLKNLLMTDTKEIIWNLKNQSNLAKMFILS